MLISCTGRTECLLSLAPTPNFTQTKPNSLISPHATQRTMALTGLLSSFQTANSPTAPRAAQGHVWAFCVVNSSQPLIRGKAERRSPEQGCSKHRSLQRRGLGNGISPQDPPSAQGPLAKPPPQVSKQRRTGAAIRSDCSPQTTADANTLLHGCPSCSGPVGFPVCCLVPAPQAPLLVPAPASHPTTSSLLCWEQEPVCSPRSPSCLSHHLGGPLLLQLPNRWVRHCLLLRICTDPSTPSLSHLSWGPC